MSDTQLTETDRRFAIYVVAMGFARPDAVADAAADCLGETPRALETVLVDRGLVTAEQRDLVRAALERERTQSTEIETTAPTPALAPSPTRVALREAAVAAVPQEQPGRYTIRKIHARGGQGFVMVARDEALGRDIALKALAQDPLRTGAQSGPSGSTARFLREARVTGLLEHPNVVPIYDLGRRADGTLYYAMRFVKGRTLSTALREADSLADRLKLLGAFWDICKAIAFAHSRGVIHRDLKPDNVMVGEFGETVVLDWGVAKVHGQDDIRATAIERAVSLLAAGDEKTRTGSAVGTPSYMSPEQARGAVDEIDERSDVWGLGAVLYELLTGVPPHGPPDPGALVRAFENQAPPVQSRCPEAPPELAAIAQKATSRDKAARYASAKELADEIGAYLTGGRVQAHAYTAVELLKRFARHHRAALGGAGAALVAIVAALVAVSVSLHRENLARRQADEARVGEHAERLLSSLHLAEAYSEKADRLLDELKFSAASVLAAASLEANPANPGSALHTPDFARANPDSRLLRVTARSQIYQAGLHVSAVLRLGWRGPTGFEAVAASRDGTLAAPANDGSIELRDARTGRLLRTLKAHDDRAAGVAFSPDGTRLASSGRDRIVRVWDPKEGRLLATLEGHTDGVDAVAFSPDGAVLASGGFDGTVRLWDVATGSALRTLAAQTRVNAIAFSPDGSRLAAGCGDGIVLLFDPASGRRLKSCAGHTDRVMAVRFSADGAAVLSGGIDRRFRSWDPSTCKETWAADAPGDGVTRITVSPDGRLAATSGYSPTFWLWDLARGRLLSSVLAHDDYIYGLTFLADGKAMATAAYDRRVRVWDLSPPGNLQVLAGHEGAVGPVAFSRDGSLVASGGWDRMGRVWERATGRTIAVLEGHTETIDAVVFDAEGRRVITGSRDKTIRVWDARTGALLATAEGHTQVVSDLDVSPDGRTLASASADRTAKLWDLSTMTPFLTIAEHEAGLKQVAFSADGKLVATAGREPTVRLWDATTGRLVQALRGHDDWAAGVAFSPDGRRLVTAGRDKVVILWDLARGAPVARLEGHGQWVNEARFSPDGRLVASGSDDGTARLWSAATGELLLIVKTHGSVPSVAFAPDGKGFAFGDLNDVMIYPTDLGALGADPTRLRQSAERSAGFSLEGFRLVIADAPAP